MKEESWAEKLKKLQLQSLTPEDIDAFKCEILRLREEISTLRQELDEQKANKAKLKEVIRIMVQTL